MKNIPVRLLLLILFFFFAIPNYLSAQNDLSDAHLAGTLLDSSGAGVGGVRVTAQLDGAGDAHTWICTSRTDGAYALAFPAGRYRVQYVRAPFVSRDFVFDFSPGQQRRADLRLELERLSSSVVVTAQAEPTPAQNTNAPVTVITREEINQRQTVLLPDLLATQPGIAITRTGTGGGLTTVFLDGGNSGFTKVLLDGTPINLPGGDLDFSNLTLDNVDKIEIVHGAESALYGTDAMSGVIQIFTHRGTTRVPEAALFTEGGSFASIRSGAQLSGAIGGFDYSAGGSYFHTDGQGVNDEDLIRSYNGNVGYSFSDRNQIRLSVRSNSSFAGTPGQTLLFPADPSAFYDLQQLSANLSWSFQTSAHWSHRVSATEARYLSDSGFPPFGSALNQANRAGGWAQSTYSFHQGGLTAGYQYEVENVTSSGFGFVHGHRNNQGGFLEGRWSPISRLTLSGGARVEANASFGTRVVPRAGAVLAVRYARGFWGDTRVRISYGKGIEEPTVLESFNTDPCSLGNPNLRPQRSRTINVGVDQYLADDRLRVSATYFADQFRDLITFVAGQQTGCPFGNTQIVNKDLSRARGVNLSTVIRVVRWLSLNGNYSFDDTRVLRGSAASSGVQVAGDHLLRRPVNSGNVWLTAKYRSFNFNVNAYFTGVRTDSDFDGLGLTRNPGYARFDIASSYNIGRGVSLYARASNLFDKHYQEAIGFPALGRDVRVGMNYRFAGRN